MNIIIRLEKEQDFMRVNTLTRDVFWNLFIPGATEHVIAHKLRKSNDFIKELSLVATIDQQIVGSIMYSKSKIISHDGTEFETLTFGPLSVKKDLQRKGIGSLLIKKSLEIAKSLSYNAVLIYGNPAYYHKFGFDSASKFNISVEDGSFTKGLMALELSCDSLLGIHGNFFVSSDFNITDTELEKFDSLFPYKEKLQTKSQEEFAELINSLAE